jgi:hypothetical protein
VVSVLQMMLAVAMQHCLRYVLNGCSVVASYCFKVTTSYSYLHWVAIMDLLVLVQYDSMCLTTSAYRCVRAL